MVRWDSSIAQHPRYGLFTPEIVLQALDLQGSSLGVLVTRPDHGRDQRAQISFLFWFVLGDLPREAFDGTGWRPKEHLTVALRLGETSRMMFLVHPTLTDSLEFQSSAGINFYG